MAQYKKRMSKIMASLDPHQRVACLQMCKEVEMAGTGELLRWKTETEPDGDDEDPEPVGHVCYPCYDTRRHDDSCGDICDVAEKNRESEENQTAWNDKRALRYSGEDKYIKKI